MNPQTRKMILCRVKTEQENVSRHSFTSSPRDSRQLTATVENVRSNLHTIRATVLDVLTSQTY